MHDILENLGEEHVLMNWQAPEYRQYQRGAWWYILTVVIGVALLGYAFFTRNFLFAVLIVMFGIIYTLQHGRTPEHLEIVVTPMGIFHGERFISYRDLKCFWIAYDPPAVTSVYLEYKRAVIPHVELELQDGMDPVAVREILKQYVPEHKERDHMPLLDILARVFKL